MCAGWLFHLALFLRLFFSCVYNSRQGVILWYIPYNTMNNNMIMTLTADEMLELWKTRLRLLPARRDCSIERDDGVDIDSVLMLDIREWYARLLAGGEVGWLPVEDLCGEVMCSVDDEGVVAAMLPATCVRPVEWRLKGWKCGVTQFYLPGSYTAMCQRNIYMRGDCDAPVAVLHDDHLELYSIDPGAVAVVERARCVVRPADGTYRFGEAALSTIQDYLRL